MRSRSLREQYSSKLQERFTCTGRLKCLDTATGVWVIIIPLTSATGRTGADAAKDTFPISFEEARNMRANTTWNLHLLLHTKVKEEGKVKERKGIKVDNFQQQQMPSKLISKRKPRKERNTSDKWPNLSILGGESKSRKVAKCDFTSF